MCLASSITPFAGKESYSNIITAAVTMNSHSNHQNCSSSSTQQVSSAPQSLEEQMILPSSLASRLLAVPSTNGEDIFSLPTTMTTDLPKKMAARVSLASAVVSSGDESDGSSYHSGRSTNTSHDRSSSSSNKRTKKIHKKSMTATITTKTTASTSVAAAPGSPSGSSYNKKKGSFTTKGYKRHFAVHNYIDYSQVQPSPEDIQSGLSISKGGVHNPFPAVLHRMMEDLDAKGFTDMCSWQPHGRAFLIKDPKRFVTDVLPLYFKHSKLSSFQRQLSLYGFKRLTCDNLDRGAYYHPCFLRGRSFLCSKIQRTRVKGTWVRTSSSPETEPNFYHMEPVRDLSALSDDTNSSGSTNDDDHSSQDYAAQVSLDGVNAYTPITTPSSTINNEKQTVQITFDLFEPTALLPPPSLPSSVMPNVVSANTSTARNIQYIDTAMSVVNAAASGGAVPVNDIPFIPSLHDDAELASFLSDIDLDMDVV